MCKKLIYLASFVLLLALAGKASAGLPEGTLLIGWHTPDGDNMTPLSDSTPDDYLTGVTGLLSGAETRTDAESTDGDYGSVSAEGSTSNAAIGLRKSTGLGALVQITNNTGSSLYLGTFHFDFSRWWDTGPTDVALYYDSGDLIDSNNVLINSAENLTTANSLVSNYDDFDWSLSALSNLTLADGESATFRIEASTYSGNDFTASGLDNIAITAGKPATIAWGPSPSEGEKEVPRGDVVLTWEPGEFADQHDVYFGTDFDQVNNAINLGQAGPDNLYRSRQGTTGYAVPESLDFGQTYYWRVDEISAGPDYTVFTGNVWSFTAEPFAVPISGGAMIVTASSAIRADEGPENTVNGSGLDGDDLHSAENTTMWLSNIIDPGTAWIQFEFDRSYKLRQMSVWNYNSTVEPAVGFGIKQATIEYSIDGADWSVLGTTHEFTRGSGTAGYAPNTTVDLGGVTAKYVKITANSNWGGFVHQFGLSEVRFLYVPVWAREPNPVSGATDVDADATLSFREGREAARHDVYLSADEQAVIDGTAPVVTVTDPDYAASLDLAGTYYWRIDEVNDVETPSTWQGDIWSLSTREYLIVDDFESYNEIPDGEEGSNLVYGTWKDGFDNPSTNGSTMGYTEAFQPSMETSVVHNGRQSVPLFYDNTTATYSEVTANIADLQVGQDWTRHGIKALTLRFFGDPTNVLQQMYVKINGSKVAYEGSAEDIRLTGWQMWYIDLASIGVSMGNVTELAIGFERIGALGGQGMVYLDGIRLYSYDPQVITPAAPGASGLQAHYEFEGNTNDSSGNARHGTIMGNPVFEPGRLGQAITFDGLNDYVEMTGYKGILGSSAVTVTAWIRTSSTDTGAIIGWGPNVSGQRFGFRVDVGRLRMEHHGGNIQGDSTVNDGAWHHVAVTVRESATISHPEVILYLDGSDDTRPTTSSIAFDLSDDQDVRIGSRPASNDRLFIGQIDDLRIYDRTLTQEEIAWLSGRTEPFDKPF